ncbi:hypothetical protein N665_1490s0003 [Sinapis alba]|nr:hypothetical protein N665_1490s0003 [Sinapis alba]
MPPIHPCSFKGKSIATRSGLTDSESSDSPLVGRPRMIMLRGMENPRPPTGDDLAELNDNEQASDHASPSEMEREAENRSAQVTNSVEEADLVDNEKNPSEKEMDFRLADFLPMRWTGTDFEFVEEIDPEKERHFCARKNHKWENHLPTRFSFKSLRKLIFQTDPPAGFTFLIPASHQRPWTPPIGYACVYESWFNNCRIWWPLPEFLTTYCSRRKIALVFFYGKMVPKYNVIIGKPTKVNFWNRSYFYVKINEASFEDPSVILNGYFNANIDRLGKWVQGCSDSFQEQVEAIRTLSHQHWPDISEALIQAALNIIIRGTPSHGQKGSSSENKLAKRRRISQSDEGAPNANPRPSPSPKSPAREHLGDGVGSRDLSPRLNEKPSPARNSPVEPVDGTKMVVTTGEPQGEHLWDPSLEEKLQEEELQEEELQGLDPASQGNEVVEYPHLIDFNYQHIEVPFVGDHEAPTCLFRQIKLRSKGMPELDELSQRVDQLLAENDQAMEMDEIEKSRGELLSKEIEEMKAQKEVLDSRLRMLEQEKIKADSKFETKTKRLRESREHKVRKERLRVEATMRQQVMPVYEKMRKYLEEQPVIQNKLFLYSQDKGSEKVIEASEINLQSTGLYEHGSNLIIFSP